jgi:hypothetical protein
MFSEMEYPHWMMIGGGILVVLGFVGLAFYQNRNADPQEWPAEIAEELPPVPPQNRRGP